METKRLQLIFKDVADKSASLSIANYFKENLSKEQVEAAAGEMLASKALVSKNGEIVSLKDAVVITTSKVSLMK